MVERSKNTDLEGAACATEKNLKEIIHVKYAGEQPTVSARELHEFLEECVSFEEFFIKVCELKVLLNRDGLSTLYAIVKKFYGRYRKCRKAPAFRHGDIRHTLFPRQLGYHLAVYSK